MNQPVIVKKEPIIKISIFMYLLNMIAYFLDVCNPKVYKNMFKSQSEQDALNRQQEQEDEEQDEEQDQEEEEEEVEDQEQDQEEQEQEKQEECIDSENSIFSGISNIIRY
jgi:flagellar biosynthesis/type III secretory pathway M-ring protein FliF/YscJ